MLFRVSSIAILQYGPIYITDLSAEAGIDSHEATSLTSWLLFAGNFMVIPISLLVGWLTLKY
jgi:hypothetical protein